MKRLLKEINTDLEIISQRIEDEKERLSNFETCENLNKLITFLVLGEDHRFYNHIGFDFIAINRAIRNRIFYSKIEGASTIEQQLVRVLTNQYERTFKRKFKEIILATKLKKLLTKNQIALLYLSLAYFGTGKHGFLGTLASFNYSLNDELTDDFCAGIIARLKYPEPKSSNLGKLTQIEIRKKHILNLYYENGKHNRLSQYVPRM